MGEIMVYPTARQFIGCRIQISSIINLLKVLLFCKITSYKENFCWSYNAWSEINKKKYLSVGQQEIDIYRKTLVFLCLCPQTELDSIIGDWQADQIPFNVFLHRIKLNHYKSCFDFDKSQFIPHQILTEKQSDRKWNLHDWK